MPKPIRKIIKTAGTDPAPALSGNQQQSLDMEKFVKDNPVLETLGDQIMEHISSPGRYESEIRLTEGAIKDMQDDIARLESDLPTADEKRRTYIPHWIASKQAEIEKLTKRLENLRRLRDRLSAAKEKDVVLPDDPKLRKQASRFVGQAQD
jgi:SMC interacting uncharacterized protein involved in chromosome segregation